MIQTLLTCMALNLRGWTMAINLSPAMKHRVSMEQLLPKFMKKGRDLHVALPSVHSVVTIRAMLMGIQLKLRKNGKLSVRNLDNFRTPSFLS